jgi:hypothetical protein
MPRLHMIRPLILILASTLPSSLLKRSTALPARSAISRAQGLTRSGGGAAADRDSPELAR